MKALGIDRLEQMIQSQDLGVVNRVKLVVGLIGDLAVGHNAGAMDQSANCSIICAYFSDDAPHASPSRTSSGR